MNIENGEKLIAFQLNDKKYLKNVQQNIQLLLNSSMKLKIAVFHPFTSIEDCAEVESVKELYPEIEIVPIPDFVDNKSKRKNFVIDTIQSSSYKNIAHVIEDYISIVKDPTEFINELENAMVQLDYDIWFSTETDGCNFLFNKFVPRLEVRIDDEEVKKKLNLPFEIIFTSNSNIDWIALNFAKEVQKFNELFSIPMYMIIEYLSRRRDNRKENQLYYMNQYMTVPAERGVFKSVIEQNDLAEDSKQMQVENEIFQSMHVNTHPDNAIDLHLRDLHNKIQEKMSIIA